MNPPTDRERPALSEVDRALIEREFPTWLKNFGAGYWTMKPASLARLLAAARAEASPKPALTQGGVVEALKLAEDVLSRSPFSTSMWPNGMHPNTGITIIRAALERLAGERGGEALRHPVEGCRDDLVERAEVIRILRALGETHADLALYGEPDNARCREAMEAAYTNARCAVALMPAAAPQPLPVEVERERIARIIDPEAFAKADAWRASRKYEKLENWRPSLVERMSEALSKADAILTAHPVQELFAENAKNSPPSPDAEALAGRLEDYSRAFSQREQDWPFLASTLTEAAALIRGSGR